MLEKVTLVTPQIYTFFLTELIALGVRRDFLILAMVDCIIKKRVRSRGESGLSMRVVVGQASSRVKQNTYNKDISLEENSP